MTSHLPLSEVYTLQLVENELNAVPSELTQVNRKKHTIIKNLEKELNRYFLQRRHINGKEVHQKVINIAYRQ